MHRSTLQGRVESLSTGELAGLEPEFTATLVKIGRIRRFGAGETLFVAGDPADAVAGVLSGSVAVRIPLPPEDNAIIHIAHAGYWFGLGPSVAQQPRPFTAEARTDLVVCWVPIPALAPMLERQPRLWRSLSTLQQNDFRLAVCVAADLMLRGHRARVSAVLLRVVGLRPDANCHAPELKVVVSHEELAAMSNLSRNYTGAALRRLAEEGAIALAYRSVQVLRPELLHQFIMTGD
jgi:CRP-like cAMP-binding protein